jgi:hypothetical protein
MTHLQDPWRTVPRASAGLPFGGVHPPQHHAAPDRHREDDTTEMALVGETQVGGQGTSVLKQTREAQAVRS